MGSNPSSLNENTLSNVAESRMAECISYNDIICVKTKPWDSEKRKSEFPFEEIQSDKISFESTVIDVDITCPTLTEQECLESDIFPMPYLTLDNENEGEFYTLKNSDGKIVVSVTPRIPKRNAIFTFHVRRKGRQSWDRYDVKKQAGEITVSIETDQLDIDAVFITSQIEVQTVEVTRAGCVENLDPENERMKIEFPPDSVESTMQVTIEVTSLDGIQIQQRVKQTLGENHGILGISDMVNVFHDRQFLVPVHLTVSIQPLDHMLEASEIATLLVLYFEDDEVRELETATVKEVEPTLFEITTDHFCPVICVRHRPNVHQLDAIAAVKYVYDLDDPRCNILLFTKREANEILFLRSEIVNQDERSQKEKERTNEMGMDLLPTCTSPTIRLKNMDRVRVSLANNTAIKFLKSVTPVSRFIIFDRNNHDNSLSFHVERNAGFGIGDFATLEYDLDSGRNRRRLHNAVFHALKELRKRNNPGSPLSSSQATLNRTPGLQTTVYNQELSSLGAVGPETVPYDSFEDKDFVVCINMEDIKKSLPQTSSSRNQPRNEHKPKYEPIPEIRPRVSPEVFSERSMTLLARQIPNNEYVSLATFLGIPMVTADRLARIFPNPQDGNQLKLRLLLHWLDNESIDPYKRLETLKSALTEIDQKGLAERVEQAFNNNTPFSM